MATNNHKPIPFMPFIFGSTIVLNILRAWLSNGPSSVSLGLAWWSVFLWVGYRIARVQEWWPWALRTPRDVSDPTTPWATSASVEPVSDAEGRTLSGRAVTADDLRRLAKHAAKTATKLAKTAKVSEPQKHVLGSVFPTDRRTYASPTAIDSTRKVKQVQRKNIVEINRAVAVGATKLARPPEPRLAPLFSKPATGPVSSVGLRLKAVRAKTTDRKKTVRRKRRPDQPRL